ncbi:tetratricopeptide repeat protein [Paenibacillus cucumis (ex Kampfer et al. 2016)]|uniref:Tetratricopeptide repeat protein n=1 Tax=Paenibacillus cucumis (ex Kampfer et al. 2016) TaxID=1776858 RepID=A0ABS7KN89_9BACL|nr:MULTISPECIES: tetratricopeptide repeat protein [Paenibacillus]MBY0205638.1 tetratricopeptide repeat protein [Paenibacillus cucumis (ex Kampfer et al. 2016)]
MKGKLVRTEGHLANIIPIHLDASFFFERAVRSLDRNHVDKALKYFRKAVEYEPENPVNHCNMAGILSEKGDYKASNAILAHVLDVVDPSMTECYFYMANNYANMDQFEEAERALVTYLEEDTQGQFMTEAEEMMELLYYELDRPAKLNRIKSRQGVVEHDQARELLEEGKFAQAAELLEGMSPDYPDYLAARNNLALAYYYMGLFSKAKETIAEVLEQEPGNLHALCNLAIFYQNENRTDQVLLLIKKLRAIVPFQHEQVYKLATTMGILGQHDAAYIHFRRLLKGEETATDPALAHYAAVAAFNTERYDIAKRLWHHVNKLDPGSEVARYYLDGLEAVIQGVQEPSKLSYHYHLPFDEQFKQWEDYGNGIPEEMKNDPLIRSSFFWALRHGDQATKLQVIHALGMIGDYEVQQALQLFIDEPGEEPTLVKAAQAVLHDLQRVEHPELNAEVSQPLTPEAEALKTVPKVSKKEITGIRLGKETSPHWQAVVDRALQMSEARAELQQEMERIWTDYVSRVRPDLSGSKQIEGWAAGLEYLASKNRSRPVTYQSIAERYGISASTVSKYARQLNQICSVTPPNG